MSSKVQKKQTTSLRPKTAQYKTSLAGPAPRRFRHKQGAVFGSSTKKEAVVDSPGPGNYEPKFSVEKPRAYEALILGDENRHGYINGKAGEIPGPGQYVEDENGIRTSRTGAFNKSKRETEFEKVQQQSARIPGPAEYTRVEVKKQGPSFGLKREQKTMMSPGPGQYNTIECVSVTRPQSSKLQFSQTKRPDLWKEEKNKANNGPAYDTVRSSFDKSNKKGATIGVKRAERVSNTPGPGQYSNANVINMVKSKGASVRIGQTKRPDNFTRNASDLPGPGNYTASDSHAFGKNMKGAATMGSKYRPAKNENPGPGQYTADSNRASNSKNGKIGTTKRPDIWEDQKKAGEAQPGPGNYISSTNTFGKNMKGAATMGSKYRAEKNSNPGPGQYEGTKSLKSTISYCKIGTTKRADLFGTDKKAKESMPGPGQHTKSYSSFGKTKGGASNFGVGRKDKRNENPGPGQYNAPDRNLSSAKSASVRIGLTKRPDIWEQSTKNAAPGPGNYTKDNNEFGKTTKGVATMGSKYKPDRNENPGPGQYSGDTNVMKTSTANGKISQAQRKDIWAEQTKNDQPGPGNYTDQPSTFGQTKGAASMGGKYKEERNYNPGPGQYDSDASKIKPKLGASVRIGSAKREELFKEQQNDQPGPGNYISDNNTFGKAVKGVASMGSKYKAERNSNPGPGQYSTNDSPTRHQNSVATIGKTQKKDIWADQTGIDAPGPGNYTNDPSSFNNVKGVANMGSKYKPERNDNPGPGQYSGDINLVKTSTANGQISKAQRQDIWAEQTNNDQPGPGNYAEVPSTFGTTKGAATMGGKYKEERNFNPGPGQYDNDASKLKPKLGASVRIGSAKREDIWKESQNELPGPGNYVSDTNTFGQAARGVATMGSKYKPEKNFNPGPGQYSTNDSPTRQQTSSVSISRAERKDIWELQTKNDAPGPGNYAENTSTFNNVKGVATMGSKYKPEKNFNPGPGQYEQALNDMSNQQTQSVRIGTQKVRNDLFGTDQAASLPGPGAYQSPDHKTKGFVIGAKQEHKIENTPGPGNYEASSKMTQVRETTVRISQAKREDIWKEQTSKMDMPGPGALDPHDPAWQDNGFIFNKDDRFPKQRDMGPGPGAYEVDDD